MHKLKKNCNYHTFLILKLTISLRVLICKGLIYLNILNKDII